MIAPPLLLPMDVLVVIPTYNERDNLPGLVRAILDRPSYRVMVVDDGSPDGTGAVADELAAEFPGRVQVVHRTGKRGLGRSYVDGLQRAVAEGRADLVCQMDADWSHDPRFLPDMVAAAATHDIVIGSRYLHGVSVVNWPLRRIILSSFANRYIHAITGLRIRDCTSGFRCWRRETLARLPLEQVASDGYAFLVETIYDARSAGATIGEVPIIFVERRLGSSKLSGGVLLESMLIPWRLRLRSLLKAGR
jgi:dolichol-phosphate mannosyltransferase